MKKITQTNDWEFRETFIDNVKVQEGHVVKVQFPDGTKDIFKVIIKDEYKTYSDHGHVHGVTSKIPYIELDIHGMKLLVELTKFKEAEFISSPGFYAKPLILR